MLNTQEVKGGFAPVQDFLVLEPKLIDERVGGILLPDTARVYGLCPVVAAGPQCELKKGDVVYIQKFVEGELKFELNGKKVYAIRERRVNVAIAPLGAKCPLKAVGNRVLVKRPTTTDGFGLVKKKGIFIPETSQSATQAVEVLSLGSGLDRGKVSPFEIKEGTTVLIARYAGTELKYLGIEYTIINENDVVGTIDESKKKPKKKATDACRANGV